MPLLRGYVYHIYGGSPGQLLSGTSLHMTHRGGTSSIPKNVKCVSEVWEKPQRTRGYTIAGSVPGLGHFVGSTTRELGRAFRV